MPFSLRCHRVLDLYYKMCPCISFGNLFANVTWMLCPDSYQIAELLCNKGASVTSLRSNGDTPLHIAVRNGNIEMLKLFMRHTTNVCFFLSF